MDRDAPNRSSSPASKSSPWCVIRNPRTRQANEGGAWERPDLWKIEIVRIPEAILERLEGQNVSKSTGNGL